MTKGEALQQFFSGFGLTAYAAASVPADTVFPYLTYDLVTGNWGDMEVSITVNLWYHTDSEALPNAKADEIADTIGIGGKVLLCDGGGICLKRGSPWCQSLADETDKSIKRRYINISAEFLTTN